MNASETKVIGTRTIEGYDEPVRIYWTKAVEGRDDDGGRVLYAFSVEDCPDFDPDFVGEQCDPYSVELRTYLLGDQEDPADVDTTDPDKCEDCDTEPFDDLADAIARAEEWAAALAEEQIEREESYRGGLVEGLESVAYEARADSPEKDTINALAALIAKGKAGDVLKALGAAGLA